MPLLRRDGKDLLFIHIPKCGGTSLEQVFSPNVQMTLLHSGPGELPCSPQHFQASLLEKLFDYRLPPAVAIVRNPFDRMVSEYRYQVQNGLDSTKVVFDKFIENSLGEFWKNKYVHDNHIRPQVEFICTDSVIFRFEEEGVSAAHKYIADYFGLSSEGNISIKNSSDKIDFPVSPETLHLINKFYARDFELLGYPLIDAEQSGKALSLLSYSSMPTTSIEEPSLIHQRVSNDIVVVSEADKARLSTEMEQLEIDRKLSLNAASVLAERLDQQSTATAEIKTLLDALRSEVESTGKHLAEELSSLYNSTMASDLNIQGVMNELGGVVAVITENIQEQHSKEDGNRDNRITASLSSFGETLLGLDKSLGDLARKLSEQSRADREFAEDRMGRARETLISTGKVQLDEVVDKIVGQLGLSIVSQSSHLSDSVEGFKEIFSSKMNEKTAHLEQKLSRIDRELDEATTRVIRKLGNSFGSHTAQISESVDQLKVIFSSAISDNTAHLEQKLSGVGRDFNEAVSRVIRVLSATINYQTELVSQFVEAQNVSLMSGVEKETTQLEHTLLNVEREVGEAAGRIAGEVTASVHSQTTQVSESVNGLKGHFSSGINLQTAHLDHKLSEIQRELEEAAGRIIDQLGASADAHSAHLSRTTDGLAQGLTQSTTNLDKKIALIQQTLSQTKDTQELKAAEQHREIIERLKQLFEIQRKEIHELDDRLAKSNANLAETNSLNLILDSKLNDAQAQNTFNKDKLEALAAKMRDLEISNDTLIAATSSLGNTIESLHSVATKKDIAWEQERGALTQESISLRLEMGELQHKFSANFMAWQQEKEVLIRESNSFRHAIGELQHTLSVSSSTWQHEKEALVQELSSRDQRIEELQQSELKLKNELDITLVRFDDEIEYRNSIAERVRLLEVDLALVRQHNATLLKSNSFRLTKPLRVLSRALRPRRSEKLTSTSILRLEDLRKDATPPLTKMRPNSEAAKKFSQLNIAIVVENLDRGGLEQVVLDHARYFSTHCKSLELFVINETGEVYEQALAHGIKVLRIKDDDFNLESYLGGDRGYNFAFFHHSYGYLPAFRSCTQNLVEVIHNEYSWQRNVEFFVSIRKQTVDRFIAVSDPVREYSISQLEIEAGNIVTIVNGLNIEGLIRPPIEILREHRTSTFAKAPTFVMCANGQPQKNHVLVIRAFVQLLKKCPQAKLQLAGNLAVDKDVETAILAELQKCGRPANIELMGSLDRRQLSRLLAKAHIALLPTKYEGFSIATLEYLYFGLPMILSNTGGASYITSNYGSVIIDKKIGHEEGPPTIDEVKSLAGNMKKMIDAYEKLSETSENAARSYLKYSVDAVCLEYLAIG